MLRCYIDNCSFGAAVLRPYTGGEFALADSRWARRVVPLRGHVRSHCGHLRGREAYL